MSTSTGGSTASQRRARTFCSPTTTRPPPSCVGGVDEDLDHHRHRHDREPVVDRARPGPLDEEGVVDQLGDLGQRQPPAFVVARRQCAPGRCGGGRCRPRTLLRRRRRGGRGRCGRRPRRARRGDRRRRQCSHHLGARLADRQQRGAELVGQRPTDRRGNGTDDRRGRRGGRHLDRAEATPDERRVEAQDRGSSRRRRSPVGRWRGARRGRGGRPGRDGRRRGRRRRRQRVQGHVGPLDVQRGGDPRELGHARALGRRPRPPPGARGRAACPRRTR